MESQRLHIFYSRDLGGLCKSSCQLRGILKQPKNKAVDCSSK